MPPLPEPGRPSDLPCPACQDSLAVRRYSRAVTLVWCERCGWNLLGTAKYLKGANLGEFARALWLMPLIIPIAILFHTQDPFVAYGLDLLLVILLFVPALRRSQLNLNLARQLDAMGRGRPARAVEESWQAESELSHGLPRTVRLRGSLEAARGLVQGMRVLWTLVFVTGLMALTPLARLVGPRAQYAALLLMALGVVPLLAATGVFLGLVWRDRHLAKSGTPCRGRVDFQVTHMRRLEPAGWTLVSRYRYGFTDPHGTERVGIAREEGRALLDGMAVTVLDSPVDPRLHTTYPACLYLATGPSKETRT